MFLLISVSWVARITGMSRWCRDQIHDLEICLPIL
jgi:hypothetical protein